MTGQKPEGEDYEKNCLCSASVCAAAGALCLRPELSYGSHFFQDLVESGIFYAAIYQGEEGCEFDESLFDACPDRYKELTGDELFEGVIRVCDLRDREAILYAEMGEQDCFLGGM